jgi:hypothetical protein
MLDYVQLLPFVSWIPLAMLAKAWRPLQTAAPVTALHLLTHRQS